MNSEFSKNSKSCGGSNGSIREYCCIQKEGTSIYYAHQEDYSGETTPAVWDRIIFRSQHGTYDEHQCDSRYNYTETSHYSVHRGGNLSFEKVPVDGSSKMDDTLMESIEPFNIADAVDFQTAYLSGFLADKYDVDAEASIERANQRIKQSTEDAFRSTVQGYTSVVPVSSTINLQNGRARYALYPVWILNTQWNGQKFTFGINGQTGKIAGDLPMDKSKFWTWLAGVSGAVAAISFALSYLFWLL